MVWRKPPPRASIAKETDSGAKMFAPAAERNAAVITSLLSDIAPASGHALELASGTGQHITELATHLPGLLWQPSEVDPARLASINAYIADSAAPNIRAPLTLDATAPGWSETVDRFDLILLVNLLHLISGDEARTLIKEAHLALAPGGVLVLYGPFKRDGRLTSDGDQRFHASLVADDPEIGYKDDRQILDWLAEAGFAPPERRELPANNLAFSAKRD